jgi:hypothetical protein
MLLHQGTLKKTCTPNRNLTLALFVLLALLSTQVLGWGFWGHKEITRRALELLPTEMVQFFHVHKDYIVQHSVTPDIAREGDTLEQFNHYIDMDYYGRYPFESLPRNRVEAERKFSADTVRVYGLLPWKIVEFTDKLSAAMKEGDTGAMLHCATYLAHYVEDAHVPLHTTLNHDGQLTGQDGIHSRFESALVEKYGAEYRYALPSSLTPIENVLDFVFAVILESYSGVDTILNADAFAKQRVPKDRLAQTRRKNGRQSVRYSDEYFAEFHQLLGGLPERRLQASAVAVARVWYTAWVKAGKPPLPAG